MTDGSHCRVGSVPPGLVPEGPRPDLAVHAVGIVCRVCLHPVTGMRGFLPAGAQVSLPSVQLTPVSPGHAAWLVLQYMLQWQDTAVMAAAESSKNNRTLYPGYTSGGVYKDRERWLHCSVTPGVISQPLAQTAL